MRWFSFLTVPLDFRSLNPPIAPAPLSFDHTCLDEPPHPRARHLECGGGLGRGHLCLNRKFNINVECDVAAPAALVSLRAAVAAQDNRVVATIAINRQI